LEEEAAVENYVDNKSLLQQWGFAADVIAASAAAVAWEK
jgi:hypothetical protein